MCKVLLRLRQSFPKTNTLNATETGKPSIDNYPIHIQKTQPFLTLSPMPIRVPPVGLKPTTRSSPTNTPFLTDQRPLGFKPKTGIFNRLIINWLFIRPERPTKKRIFLTFHLTHHGNEDHSCIHVRATGYKRNFSTTLSPAKALLYCHSDAMDNKKNE